MGTIKKKAMMIQVTAEAAALNLTRRRSHAYKGWKSMTKITAQKAGTKKGARIRYVRYPIRAAKNRLTSLSFFKG